MSDHDIASSLSALKIVDLGRGFSSGIAAKLLAEFGSPVQRFETADDPFRTLHPAYDVWHSRAAITRVENFDDPRIDAALASAQVCLVGGEDHPALRLSRTAAALRRDHRHLIVLSIDGELEGGADRGRRATEILVQARTGLVSEQFSERPFLVPYSPASYCAALHLVAGGLAALCSNVGASEGRLVQTSLYEGALTMGAQYWMSAEHPDNGFMRTIPKDPRHIIFPCRDGRYMHIVLGALGSKGSLYRVLGIDDPNVRPEDSGVPTGKGDPRNFFGDIDLLSEHARTFDSAHLMAELNAAGVPASFVGAPGECWDDAQVGVLGIVESGEDGMRHIGRVVRGTFNPGSAEPLKTTGGATPLRGSRILDFGTFTAGPFASVALADLAADVIKVETFQGDPNRGIATSYATANRGKRAVVIDLKSPEGNEIASRLLDSADAVYNNFRPGVSKRLGLDPDTLMAKDPGKIVLESTGFGRSGPDALRPGFDMILQAYTGHEVRAGGVGNVPLWDRTIMVDYTAGLLNQIALLIGLWRRATGHGGADLDVSLIDAGLFLMSNLLKSPDGALRGEAVLDSEQTGFHPATALYQGRDGWFAVDACDDVMAARLAALTGASARARVDWGEAERVAIARWAQDRDVADALRQLAARDIWADACETSGGAALRRKGAPEGLLICRPHQTFGAITQVGALFRIDGERPKAALGVPVAGEHTREVVSSLGYSADEVDDFYRRGIVG